MHSLRILKHLQVFLSCDIVKQSTLVWSLHIKSTESGRRRQKPINGVSYVQEVITILDHSPPSGHARHDIAKRRKDTSLGYLIRVHHAAPLDLSVA